MKVRRVDFYPDDWLAGTEQLTAMEVMVYHTICTLIYSTGGPVPIARLEARMRLHGVRKSVWKRCVDCLKTAGKLSEDCMKIDQRRCETELERARNRSEKAQNNVAKRWKNKETPDTDVSTGVMLPSNTRAPNKQQTSYNKQQTAYAGNGLSHVGSEAIPAGKREPSPTEIADVAAIVHGTASRLRSPDADDMTAEQKALLVEQWNRELGLDSQ